MPRRTLALLLAAAAALTACRKSDAERARAERAALAEKMRSAPGLVPYRLLKLAVRAEGAPDAPPELQAIGDQVERISEASRRREVKADAEVVARVAVLAWQARSLLDRRDEDEFPLLWSRFGAEPPPPWYDAGTEHLGIAFLEGMAQLVATRGQGDKSGTLLRFAAYELSRAEPAPSWPRPQRLVARFERGLLFAANDLHYAADEELTAYLAELDEGSARLLLRRVPGQQNPLLLLRGGGRLARGWNRLELGREELGLADLDDGLRDLEGAGIENELTLWTWAFVHARRGKPAEAAATVSKLAASPYLDAEAREALEGVSASLRSSGKLPGTLARGRALLLVGRALVARAGGAERLVAALVGPEAARQLFDPVDRLVALQRRVAEATDPERFAGQAKALGAKWYDAAREAVKGDEADGAKKP